MTPDTLTLPVTNKQLQDIVDAANECGWVHESRWVHDRKERVQELVRLIWSLTQVVEPILCAPNINHAGEARQAVEEWRDEASKKTPERRQWSPVCPLCAGSVRRYAGFKHHPKVVFRPIVQPTGGGIEVST